MTVKALMPARIVDLVAPLLVLLHSEPRWLVEAHREVERKLGELHLQLNPRKTILQPVSRGIDFVGHVIKPWRRTTRPRTLMAALDRIETLPPEGVHESVNSYFGLLTQATHSHADRASLARAALRRGHCVSRALTKTYRPAALAKDEMVR